MAVPKQRNNSSRGKRRRAGHAKLAVPSLVSCKECNNKILPHKVCSFCGAYGKGRKISKN